MLTVFSLFHILYLCLRDSNFLFETFTMSEMTVF